ncbi:hypothetical protein [Breznakiella homolactica]|uniref:Uncharacterized protein n=1 Tax=Breznakiella homolactica TaxID=2798577 RepID=A0A7T7XKJ3_9SPIR|nr:hypothetical protein [Breznakiella homolactica]QQO07888.1 hypothetical protein JFL75_13175 [Breznakiella homolactica]
MNMKKRYITAAAAVLLALVSPALFAQESFGGFDSASLGGDDSFGGDGFGGFADDAFGGGGFGFAGGSALTIGGKASFEARAILGGDAYKDYFDIDEAGDGIYLFPNLSLDIGYSGGLAELSGTLQFDEASIRDYPEDILEELTLRLYAGNFVIEGGKMKLVWGKGDKLHVVDNFNANDYTDFIIPDYIDRRIAEPMFRVAWNGPAGLRLEGVYAPMMTADRSAASGIWAPGSLGSITAVTGEVLGAQADIALQNNDAVALLAAAAKADSLLPATSSFDYGQAGLRVTHTLGPVDLGASYYYGHYKQPTADLSGYLAAKASGNPAALASDTALPSLHYDRLQVFGLEAAAAAGRFNLRGEAAYYLTDDTNGDDPWVRNNSFNWVAGFDVDLPVHNINLNIQNQGSWIMNHDKIGSGAVPEQYDTDYRSHGKATSNRISFLVSDTFLRDKLELSCNFIWGIEGKEFLLLPKLDWNITDGLNLIVSGMYINSNTDGEFYDYRDNSFVQIGMSYKF